MAVKKASESNIPDLTTLNSWYDFSYQASRKKRWDFFVIDQFLKGNHNIRGNPDDNTIEVGKRADTISYPINKIFSTFRAVRAFVTRHKPVIEVEPENSSEEAKAYARRANAMLERDNQLNNSKRLNKEWVYYGIKYGIGWRQVGYDPVKKCAMRWTIDPFDLLIGSRTGKLEDAPYVIKTVVRTVGYWKNKYPKANVVPDNEIAADEYKKLALELQYQNSEGKQPLMEQTAIGMECWYRLFTPNSKGGYINKCLFTKTEIIEKEETPYTEYPFIPYEAEIVPNEIYPDGHLKHVIAPQRMLNLLNTQMLEYNHIVNRGRFITEKNAGFSVINAKEGQIITINRGKKFEVVNPPAVNPLLQWQTTFADSAIEDLGGQHDASLGTTPARVTSGDAIEALQLGDSNNISDLRDNFEDALALEAAWILKMYSLFESEGVVINDKVDKEEMPVGMIGKAAYDNAEKELPDRYYMEANGTYCDVCAILPDNHVKVSVTSQLGETKQARIALLKDLVAMGALPVQKLLEHLEFPNTPDILERLAKEAVADIAMENLKQTGGAVPPGQIPQQEEGADVEELMNIRNEASNLLEV